jgi:Lipocalin-like domain
MKMLNALALVFGLCASVPAMASGPSAKEMLVGTWKLVSTEERLRDGRVRPYPDAGPDGRGYLIYSADGHMCASLMNPARPKWHADEEHATDAERLSAASGFFAYCGTYRVDEENKVILHYPEVSLFPNFIGTEQKRPYHFEGNPPDLFPC